MLQRLVAMAGTILGLVGKPPAGVRIRRRWWGWDLTVAWHPVEEEADPVGFTAGLRTAGDSDGDEEDEED